MSKLGGVLIWVDLAWLGGIRWSLSHVFQLPRYIWGDGTDLALCVSFLILWKLQFTKSSRKRQVAEHASSCQNKASF